MNHSKDDLLLKGLNILLNDDDRKKRNRIVFWHTVWGVAVQVVVMIMILWGILQIIIEGGSYG